MEKTELDGGCYVLPPGIEGTLNLKKVIGGIFGAKHISQQIMTLGQEPAPILSFGKSQVVLFIIAGTPTITIAGKAFQAGPETGLSVRPGEAFRVATGGGFAQILITVCPKQRAFPIVKSLGDNFDDTYPDRMVAPDAARKEEMGDRYYQVLVGEKAGSSQVTQFIGEIPPGKAPSHHHLYEEALYILSGEGRMWTGKKCAPVGPGSIIFLPRGQEHSLECTSKGGLRLAGHFYPAGSPAENY